MTTREEWLTDAAAELVRRYALTMSQRLPRCSVGHPARQGRSIRLTEVVTDAEGFRQVYVSPYVSDPAEVLACLLYALAECVEGRTPWALRESLGFTDVRRGVFPLPHLASQLLLIAGTLPAYPHVYTDPAATRAATQTTRMLRVSCESGHEPYLLRMTRTQAERGLPRCGVCDARMTLDA